ncbi:MAG TPA: GIY-YIG nuclease family protein [Candidatus Paceibacterota bacterium]
MTIKMQSRLGGTIIPQSPGVYFFKNSRGIILYVGKATNLKARLSSYFQKNQKSLKIKSLLNEASSISWNILNSETEALIKESELIKKYQPKYNVLMRDDKQYFFVAITKETYPRIFLTHQPTKNYKLSTIDYIGPFTDGAALKSVLKLLRRIFPYCTCKNTHKNLCLNARIGRCLGYCCTKTMDHGPRTKNYSENISSIKKILSGKNKSLLKTLNVEMKKASLDQLYENAAILRNQIRALEKIFAHKEMISRDIVSENIKAISALESILKIKNINRIEAYDIANIQGKYAYGSMAVFINGTPAKDLYRIFKIKTVQGSNDMAMLKEVITRRFQHKEWKYSDVILVDGGKQQLNAVSPPLQGGAGGGIKIIALTKNKKHIGDHIYISGHTQPLPLDTIPSPLKNLLINLDSEAHRFAIKHYRQSHRNMLTSN